MGNNNRNDFLHYGNLLDYLIWRGDIDFSTDPWNEIDSLVFATVAYANFGENTLHFTNALSFGDFYRDDVLNKIPQDKSKPMYEDRMHLLELMGQSRRFQAVRILDQVNTVDEDRNIQFSAVTFDIQNVGTVIAYRGTDPSLVGWKEDFMMSYETPVPAQTFALEYLKMVAEQCPGNLYLTGHSKGGNLVLYSAANAPEEIQARLYSACSFDGPGLDDETMKSEGYLRICDRVYSVIPSQSVIGLLLNYHPNYRVVDAVESFLWQHNPFTWKISGRLFVTVDTVTPGSQVLDQSVHEWLKECTREQRETLVNSLFSFLEKPENGTESSKLGSTDIKKVLPLVYSLLSIHAGNSYGEKIRKPLALLAEELRWRDRNGKAPAFKSKRIDIDNRGYHFADALEESEKISRLAGISRKNAIRLRLITEEMLGMVRGITGQCKASFRILCDKDRFELFLTTRARMDEKKRSILKASGTGDSVSFQNKLRTELEKALNTDSDSETDVLAEPGSFEQSMLYRLADSIRIDVYGGSVFVTVIKDFGSSNLNEEKR